MRHALHSAHPHPPVGMVYSNRGILNPAAWRWVSSASRAAGSRPHSSRGAGTISHLQGRAGQGGVGFEVSGHGALLPPHASASHPTTDATHTQATLDVNSPEGQQVCLHHVGVRELLDHHSITRVHQHTHERVQRSRGTRRDGDVKAHHVGCWCCGRCGCCVTAGGGGWRRWWHWRRVLLVLLRLQRCWLVHLHHEVARPRHQRRIALMSACQDRVRGEGGPGNEDQAAMQVPAGLVQTSAPSTPPSRTCALMLYCCAAATSCGSLMSSTLLLLCPAAPAAAASCVLPGVPRSSRPQRTSVNGKVEGGGRPPCMPMMPDSWP